MSIAKLLAHAIGEATGMEFAVHATEPVSGGCIHKSMRLKGESPAGPQSYFAKVNDAERKALFEAEAEGLRAIRAAGALRVPSVITHGHEEDDAWLILEWLDLAPLDTKSAAALGERLAEQHRLPQEKFGWARDNFIGSSPQLNGWSDDWLAFWKANRLHAQLRFAAHNRLPSRMIDRGERLVTDCDVFFRTYAPAKSLLHGDLWAGNAAALANAEPVVFDPAVYVGDRETDVAMTELFGGFPKEFKGAYSAIWALDEGYATRRHFYNLYHVLNHANLFGAGYVRDAEKSIERLLAEIR
jgi:protein-ribulosamine 3-kinase